LTQVKLTAQELNDTLSFLETNSSSIFFPELFELAAIHLSWDKIRPILEHIELLSYDAKPAYEIMAPKQKYAVRPIQLLDPVDNILYTGIVLRLAPLFEKKRIPRSKNIANSYRFSHPVPGIPHLINDWDAHSKAIRERLNKYKMVAKADIVDFFPRIYQHRLENALYNVTKAKYETRALMRLLAKWSDGTSYGIPVGPLASNLIAEALLIEVDEYLISCKIDFVRWIDDYLIFADTESACLQSLVLLGTRLHKTQGLSLNMAKTATDTCSNYKAKLDARENPSKHQRQRIIREVFKGDPYKQVKYSELKPSQKALVDALDAKATMEEALRGDLADLETVKFVLNVLSALRRPELIDIVLDNLARLSPVSDAVARFLNVFDKIPKKKRREVAKTILNYVQQEAFIPEFQIFWLLEPFTRSEKWNQLTDLRAIAREHFNDFVGRQAVLALGQIGNRSALLDLKSNINATVDWIKRAIIYACRKLPQDERDAFYSTVAPPGNWTLNNLLVRAIIHYSKISS
jgi:hypothetical protein